MSEQNIANSLTGSTAAASLPLAVAEHPDEAPVLAVASLRAGATAAQAGASSGPGSSIESYADLAVTLPWPHGADCPDLICADARKALGHRPLIPEIWRPARSVDLAATYPLWIRPARLLGLSLAEYAEHRLDGERWCSGHADWHDESEFYPSSPRVTRCREAHGRHMQRLYAQRREERAS